MTNPYPADFRERALRMLAQARLDHLSDFAAASHAAGRLGVNPETLRLWKKRADIDADENVNEMMVINHVYLQQLKSIQSAGLSCGPKARHPRYGRPPAVFCSWSGPY